MPKGIGDKKILFKGGTLAYCPKTICLHIFSAAIIWQKPQWRSFGRYKWRKKKKRKKSPVHSCSFENGSRWQTEDGENFPQWLIGLLFCGAVACMKTASSLGQAHNELSVQIGNPSQLSGNKQWLVDNGGLVQLSSSCSYIRTTGTCSVCPGKMWLAV